eukprot:4261092-Heterocapsa_arctica.AAC.1
MYSKLVLERPDPLDDNSGDGHPRCHGERLADGTWILGNPNFEKAFLDELGVENAMGNVKPSPRPITSARSAEE